MKHVESFFEILTYLYPMLQEKILYLMTDDTSVVEEIKSKY